VAIRYTTKHFFDGVTLHPASEIIVVDGVIESVQPLSGTAEHFVISPGLIDLQMNGFGSVDVAIANSQEFQQLDTELLFRGTTAWLGTVVTAPLERLDNSVQLVDANINSTNTGCLGIHIEGPFLGSAPGAHNPNWIIPFDVRWSVSLPSNVRLMTVAPEQIGVIDNIGQLRQRGIVVSLGHTRASSFEWEASVAAGAQMVTHLFNGMSGVHHRDGGIALHALTDNRVVCGLIADMVHVSPQTVSLAFASKQASGVCLVSDSIAWLSDWAQRRNIQVIDGAPRLPDGTLAGSSTPLAECVRHAVNHCGVSLTEALTAATSTPATVLGYPHLGHIRVGQRADLVAFNDELSVVDARRGLVSIRG
jgi:N-acetylglucosamine-6-phosphate deacetylase